MICTGCSAGIGCLMAQMCMQRLGDNGITWAASKGELGIRANAEDSDSLPLLGGLWPLTSTAAKGFSSAPSDSLHGRQGDHEAGQLGRRACEVRQSSKIAPQERYLGQPCSPEPHWLLPLLLRRSTAHTLALLLKMQG